MLLMISFWIVSLNKTNNSRYRFGVGKILMKEVNIMNYFNLTYNDLTDDEKMQVTETYVCIREHEEGRNRNEINNDYPEPIDPTGVENCKFHRTDYGYVEVLI